MNEDQGAYNLNNIYIPLYTSSSQSSGKQSNPRDVTSLRSRWWWFSKRSKIVTVSEISVLDMIKNTLD